MQRTGIFCLLLAGVVTVPLSAQFYQQGPKLVSPGSSQNQGTSVAVCADGNTMLVGAPLSGEVQGSGVTHVFTRTDGRWRQLTTLAGTDNAGWGQGTAVAISADCNTALVGGPNDTDVVAGQLIPHGAVWVFTRTNGQWSQQGNKLVGSGIVSNGALQGSSVALSADGNTAVIGGPGDNNSVGAVWVFTRRNGQWTQQGGKLVGAGAADAAGQGTSVAVSADGNSILTGGSYDKFGVGAVWAFTRNQGHWTQLGPKLVGSDTNGLYQGASVAISGDGKTAWVGAPRVNGNAGRGSVWVYTLVNGQWTLQTDQFGQHVISAQPTTDDASQGTSVALSYDGNTGVLGAPNQGSSGIPYNQPPGDLKTGAAWAFNRIDGQYVQQGDLYNGALNAALIGAGDVGQAQQGAAVAMSADGNTVVVGAPRDDCPRGAQQPQNCYFYAPATGAAWMFALAPASDDFHSTTLNTGIWKFQNPAGGSYSMTGTNLLLTAPGGSNHDPAYGGVNNSVRVTQAMPDVDFSIDTKFDSIPRSKYQEEGILVEQDQANYLRFEVYSDGSIIKLYGAAITAGSQHIWLDTPIAVSGSSVWLRLTRSGLSWTLGWSTDGRNYDFNATLPEQPLHVARIGPYAGNFNAPASAVPAFTASVAHFYNSTNAPAAEDSQPLLTNSSNSSSAVSNAANLAIQIVTDPPALELGRTATYTFLVSNVGTLPANGATVIPSLPGELTALSMSGSGWSCDKSALTCTRVPGQDVLPGGGASYPPIQLTVDVMYQATNPSHTVTEIATVVSNGADGDPSNNWAYHFSTIVEPAAIVNDSFVQGPLNTDVWRFVDNPGNQGTYVVTGDHLLLTAPGGSSHDPVLGGNHSICVLQAVKNDDFALETKLDSIPSLMYQMEGILVEQDASNYMRFEVYSKGAGPRLYLATIQNGVQTVKLDVPIATPRGSVWLRVSRTLGFRWTLTWSADGSTYNTGLIFDQQGFVINNLGPYAGNYHPTASATPAFTASVDYFIYNMATNPPAQTIRPDAFNVAGIDPVLWTFLNPAGGTVTTDNQHAILTVPGGANHDPVVGGNNSARLVQSVPNADFGVDVKFDSIPTRLYQMEGFLVEQDPSNYLRFEVFSDGSSPRLYAATIVNGVQTVNYNQPISIGGGSVWIRVLRKGTQYQMLWSTNGTTFKPGPTVTQSLMMQRAGIYAANYALPASAAPAFSALADSVSALPCFSDGCHAP